LAIGLHGDKKMLTNSNVKLANDVESSVRSTGATQALAEGNGASENAYGRPHAPRSGAPNNAALTGLHFDISSTTESSDATRRLRISECARPSPRPLDLIRASYRRRIGDSPTDQVSQIHSPIWSRGRTAHSSHPLPASPVEYYNRRQLADYCRSKCNHLLQKRRVDSEQTKSIPSPIPRPVHRVAFTTLRLAPTMTHVPTQLSGRANDSCPYQISRNKP
jgi:hypothetical protein